MKRGWTQRWPWTEPQTTLSVARHRTLPYSIPIPSLLFPLSLSPSPSPLLPHTFSSSSSSLLLPFAFSSSMVFTFIYLYLHSPSCWLNILFLQFSFLHPLPYLHFSTSLCSSRVDGSWTNSFGYGFCLRLPSDYLKILFFFLVHPLDPVWNKSIKFSRGTGRRTDTKKNPLLFLHFKTKRGKI